MGAQITGQANNDIPLPEGSPETRKALVELLTTISEVGRYPALIEDRSKDLHYDNATMRAFFMGEELDRVEESPPVSFTFTFRARTLMLAAINEILQSGHSDADATQAFADTLKAARKEIDALHARAQGAWAKTADV